MHSFQFLIVPGSWIFQEVVKSDFLKVLLGSLRENLTLKFVNFHLKPLPLPKPIAKISSNTHTHKLITITLCLPA